MHNNKKEDFIVIISSVPFPYGNASDNAIYTFMDGFQEHGCKGEVLCLFPNLPEQYDDVKASGTYKGVEYKYLLGRCHPYQNKYQKSFAYRYLTGFRLKNYLKRKAKQYSVTALFIMHVNDKFFEYTQICHKCGVEVVQVGCEYPEYLLEDTEARRQMYRGLSKHIDKYVFETKTLEDYEKEVLGKGIVSLVVPATMPVDDILDKEKEEVKPYIAYSGSVHSDAKDGLSNIIKGYAKFHESHNDIDLKFIGRISNIAYYEELQKLIKELSLDNCISFTKEVSREEYVRLMNNAKLMVVAKPKDSYYGGGLSSKVIEYLFSGNPIVMVASDDYVHYLTHKKNVYFTEDNQPETLCKAFCEMFDNKELRELIGNNGRRFAIENFNYHILTKSLLDYILGNCFG